MIAYATLTLPLSLVTTIQMALTSAKIEAQIHAERASKPDYWLEEMARFTVAQAQLDGLMESAAKLGNVTIHD